ncbi:MAG: hypothetical protein EBT55_06195, partial [Proteobacteria bacterium]|nr:hypothetical protein [Pseudomonadota bacterium]
ILPCVADTTPPAIAGTPSAEGEFCTAFDLNYLSKGRGIVHRVLLEANFTCKSLIILKNCYLKCEKCFTNYKNNLKFLAYLLKFLLETKIFFILFIIFD